MAEDEKKPIAAVKSGGAYNLIVVLRDDQMAVMDDIAAKLERIEQRLKRKFG